MKTKMANLLQLQKRLNEKEKTADSIIDQQKSWIDYGK